MEETRRRIVRLGRARFGRFGSVLSGSPTVPTNPRGKTFRQENTGVFMRTATAQ